MHFPLDLRPCFSQRADLLPKPESHWATLWFLERKLDIMQSHYPAAADAAHICAKSREETKRAAKNHSQKKAPEYFEARICSDLCREIVNKGKCRNRGFGGGRGNATLVSPQ